jgi:hypothetical protein
LQAVFLGKDRTDGERTVCEHSLEDY